MTPAAVISFTASSTGCLYDHIRWGEAFVIVYSVTDKTSFLEAQFLLGKVGEIKLPTYFSTLLLGNKRDLDHFSVQAQKGPISLLSIVVCIHQSLQYPSVMITYFIHQDFIQGETFNSESNMYFYGTGGWRGVVLEVKLCPNIVDRSSIDID
ncbi:hypothetical protein M8J77_004444 [Diaphorina citri]|nr:hypothetical protein M8J77_004444 [Diaphorina citri]